MSFRIFLMFAAMLGVFVIVAEIFFFASGFQKNNARDLTPYLSPLPPRLNAEIIDAIRDKEKSLLYNREQFLGLPAVSATPVPTIE